MASNVTVIGKSTRVRGRVHGPGDIEVQGLVDGEVSVTGDVTLALHGMVGAGIKGRKLVIRGAVKGDLVADEAILLEDGARVVGDLRAPRVAIGVGALVRGYVETGEEGSSSARARTQTAARAAPVAATHAPERPHTPARAPAPAQAKVAAPPARAQASGATNSGPRRPPPPVVPVLKGAKGQIAKKKER
jgi:cytoskeletal protein CcmA (bactofilin family)